MKMDDPSLPFLEWATSPPDDPFGVSKVDLGHENNGVDHPRVEDQHHALGRGDAEPDLLASRLGSSSATREAETRTD